MIPRKQLIGYFGYCSSTWTSTSYRYSKNNLFCFSAHHDAKKIQCLVGGGNDTESQNGELILQASDCPDGITQCMKSGPKLGGEFTFDWLILI